MKKFLPLVFFMIVFSVHSQKTNDRFTQFDISVPLRGNSTYGEVDLNGVRSDYFFLPDGLNLKYGIGIHHEKWISVGAHSGIDWLYTQKLVLVPVYASLKLNPKIGKEARIYMQLGYGKSFAIGRGDLMGEYKKISLGIENLVGESLFIQVANYGFPFGKTASISTLSVGASVTVF